MPESLESASDWDVRGLPVAPGGGPTASMGGGSAAELGPRRQITPSAPLTARARIRRRLRRYTATARDLALPRATVRPSGWDAVTVARHLGGRAQRYELTDPRAAVMVSAHTLVIHLSDAAALARLAMSAVVQGRTWRLQVRLQRSPRWVTGGARPPQLDFELREMSWHRRGSGVELRYAWSRPRDISLALHEALRALLRARQWDQIAGPVFMSNRESWLAGITTWPQGLLSGEEYRVGTDEEARPLGPFLPAAAAPAAFRWPLIISMANPHGRVLAGTAATYRGVAAPRRLTLHSERGATKLVLDAAESPESAVAASRLEKYAVVSFDEPFERDPFVVHALRALAASGLVFAAQDQAVRAELEDLDLITVADPSRVTDLAGYRLSILASRRAMISGDPALRSTALGSGTVVPLPTVSVVVASRRRDCIDDCIRYLAAQTYPAFEIVVGTHGYTADEEAVDRWRAALRVPLRIVALPAHMTLGEVLGRISRIADGELITKIDDDDHYGADHLTDLMLAWHSSGADLVAKGARFVHLPDLDCTIDRGWAAPEAFNVTPAGGTLTLARSTLAQAGGWSTSSRHVDSDLSTRVRVRGGVIYRTHGLDYIYVRRTGGHTWETTMEELTGQVRQVYKGLPREIIHSVPDSVPP
jgi:Glycosyl transferase family 2